MRQPRRWVVLLGALVAAAGLATASSAASTVVVTPSTTQGWSTDDTRPGGAVNFVSDASSPFPAGALQLTTDATTTSKAQYMHSANTPLATVTELSYATKQVSAAFAGGDPSYQLAVDLGGPGVGFTTFVYEPYENGTVIPGAWQLWNVAAGKFWSSRTVPGGECSVSAGFGGAPFYTLTQITAMCPSAVVVGFGVNIGSNNPSYVVEADGVNFNGTTYDFQLSNVPTDDNQCKRGGYVNYTDENGTPFKNQGQCVSYVEDHTSHDRFGNQGGNQGGGRGDS
jgi:hypothetical protein